MADPTVAQRRAAATGTPPERFALEHAHYELDLPFWRGLAGEVGSPVLDLGAAVGRVSIPLARDGHEVWALDANEDMLRELVAAARREQPEVFRRIHPVRADLRDFALGRTFPLAIIPMNTLQAMLTHEEQRACLRRARDHLDPLGELAFDVAVADLDSAAAAVGEVQAGEVWRDEASGATLRHSARLDSVDRRTGTVAFTAEVEEIGPNGAAARYVRTHTVHLFSPSELWELVAEAGLAVRAVYGDFAGGPLMPDSERQIYRCGVAG